MGTYDNAFGGALHDPMFDMDDAWCVTILGHDIAWTADDDVYIRHEAGFDILLGQLKWEDNDDPTDDFGYNAERLREFVISSLKETK
jgi:hypothetical protein